MYVIKDGGPGCHAITTLAAGARGGLCMLDSETGIRLREASQFSIGSQSQKKGSFLKNSP